MPVRSTSHHSVQVLGFDEYGHLTPVQRLVSASCSSGPRFAIGLPSDSQSPAKPLPLANSSPCRVSRGLSPPSKCALPGARRKRAPRLIGCPLIYEYILTKQTVWVNRRSSFRQSSSWQGWPRKFRRTSGAGCDSRCSRRVPKRRCTAAPCPPWSAVCRLRPC